MFLYAYIVRACDTSNDVILILTRAVRVFVRAMARRGEGTWGAVDHFVSLGLSTRLNTVKARETQDTI